MLAKRGETYETRPQERTRDLIIAGIATVYTLFLLYAGGMKFIAAVGGPLCARHRALFLGAPRAGQAGVHRPSDWVIFIVAVIGAVVGIYGLATGYITI